ncbi:MAG: Holliday junction branch migration DNA helicase RuvB [Clostridia bacterium]|nr:Holliday junction branch migration DNA helicase RuvB [Clostridia bacterium]
MFDDTRRIITSTLDTQDIEMENNLRPKTMDKYIGQDKLKEKLLIYIQAAQNRGEPLDHCLFYGPAGLGKTTLAHIIANQTNKRIVITSGPAIERAADLAAVLTNMAEGEVLFIDEIHRLNHNVEEILYPALEDYALDFMVGRGPSAKSVRIPLSHFTLIGATTKAGKLSQPLRDRFGIKAKLEMYTPEQLAIIVNNSAQVLNIEIDQQSTTEIARRSRGTPRVANRLLKRTRDYAQIKGKGIIDIDITRYALNNMEIDELGLDNVDKAILYAIIDKFNGGPVGVESLSAMANEDVATIEDVYEPYLLQLGFIMRTPRGRVCLESAYKHLGREMSEWAKKQQNASSQDDE